MGGKLVVFFTLTNVSFEEFGEGSFDKGVLRIPYHSLSPMKQDLVIMKE